MKQHRLRVYYENMVLHEIFGLKSEEAAGEWRRLHSEELNNLYASPYTIRVKKSRSIRWARHIAGMGELKNVKNILNGKPKGNKPLGRTRHRWEDIRMDITEVGWEGADWIYLA
jgi:hypothetical protein